jgi:uncharacterized membrane protein YphA (DoxX/SURF4 family)
LGVPFRRNSEIPFPDSLGVGRFVKIGPWPQVMAPFVSAVEIICRALLLIGLMTRLASIPLLIDICVALYATKIVTLAKNGLGAHCTKPAPTEHAAWAGFSD